MVSIYAAVWVCLVVVYYIFVIWQRSDLIKIRTMNVETYPNIIPIAFFIIGTNISNFLGNLTTYLAYRLVYLFIGFRPEVARDLGIGFNLVSGPLLWFIIISLIHYAYRSRLLKMVRPENPPLANLPAINGILFWAVTTIYFFFSWYVFF